MFKLRNEGFTLIELMISLVLGLIILLAVLQVFESSNLSYIVQEDVAAMQQDVRVSKMFLEKDMRMAGAGLDGYPLVNGLTAEDVQPFKFENGVGQGNSDIITIRYVIVLPDSCGKRPSDVDASVPSCDSYPALTLAQDMMPSGSATANVGEDLTEAPFDIWDGDCYCGGEEYTAPQPQFEAIITTPGGDSDIIKVTQVTPHKPNPSGSKYSTVQNHKVGDFEKTINLFPAGSTISFYSLQPMNVFRYYINADNVLIREDLTEVGVTHVEPIAENIEDLQFAFGLDSDGNGTVDYWVDGSNSDDLTAEGDLLETDKPLVRSVRISVLGRTQRQHQDLPKNKRPAIEDNPEAGDADFFHRRLRSVTVDLRNLPL